MSPAERRFLVRLNQRAAALSPELRDALLAAFRALIAQMKPADLARLIERGDIEGAVRLALSDDIMQRAFYPVRERIRQGTLANARSALRHVPIRAVSRDIIVAFDPELNPFVREAIGKLQSGAIQYTTGQVRDAFRTAITNGLEAGINPRQVASGLKNVVGLTGHQERIIGNFHRAIRDGDYAKALSYELRDKRFDPTLRRLLREGKVLSPTQLDEMGNAYRRKFVARNAETMARTAALESQRVGQQMAWREAAASGALGGARVIAVWVATLDARVREEHAAMHHAEREIDGVYRTGESVPGEASPWNCRCTETFKVVKPTYQLAA